ncbi:MAG: peptidase [Burkholderiaceae bacterium]|nr:peptidase [Burkholderiaceae bacterium]
MRTLNTTFNHESNNLCNNAMFSTRIIRRMHEQMTRLYEAAKNLKKIDGPSELARRLGTSPQTINNWERRGISNSGMLQAQKEIGCSAEWLKTGRGLMVLAPQFAPPNIEPANNGMTRIPLISYVQAGGMTEAVDPYSIGDAAEWLLTDLELSANSFALRVKGDSMLPEFREGDIILVDPAVEPMPGDFVVAKNGENEATFKKYRPRGINERGEKVFELTPLNDDYESMRSDITPIRIIGTMIEHRRFRRK